MIWSSRTGKLGLLLASAGAHGLAAYLWWGAPQIRVEGGAEAAVQARLGNSFADLAAGILVPEPPKALDEVLPTDVVQPTTPDSALETPDPEQMAETLPPEAMRPTTAKTTDPVRQEEVLTSTPTQQAITPERSTEASVQTPALTAVPIVPLAQSAIPTPVETQEQIEPRDLAAQTIAPQTIEPIKATPPLTAVAPPPEELQALPEDRLEVSPRPQGRPQRIEQTAEQPRTQDRQPRPAQQAPQGNADQNADAGSETGDAQATAPRQSTNNGRTTAAGNAAANNYPGRVMRCISSAGRPRVNARGTAIVAFAIAANGRVGQVRIVRSSGSARLDRAAMQTISRAGPCPAPPAGALRSYQISIRGRG